MFPIIINQIIEYEGVYSNSPQDVGGETRWGVTRKLYENVRPDGEFDNSTEEEMVEIYKEVFWKDYFDEIDESLQLVFMDTLINHGSGKATKMIQGSLGVEKDGLFGPITTKAAKECDPPRVILSILEKRKTRMLNHPYASGLISRLLQLESDSLNLYYVKNLANIESKDEHRRFNTDGSFVPAGIGDDGIIEDDDVEVHDEAQVPNEPEGSQAN